MGKVFTFFIIALWAISTYFEWKRKREKALKRKLALQSQKEGPVQSPPALEAAEKEVKHQPYRTTKRGGDLQIRSEDIQHFLQEAFNLPDLNSPEPHPEAKKEEATIPMGEYLKEKKAPSEYQKPKPLRKLLEEPRSLPSRMHVVPRFKNDELTKMIVANEILRPPLALRGRNCHPMKFVQ